MGINTVFTELTEPEILTRLSNGDGVKMIASEYGIKVLTLEKKIIRMRKCYECHNITHMVSKFIKGEIKL